MSEHFPSIRHLAGHIETELTRYQQLKAAITEVSTLLSTVEDRKRQLADYEAKITEAQVRLREATATFERFTADLTQKRRDLHALYQSEQQERQKAREKFETEKSEQQEDLNTLRTMAKALDGQIREKQKELEELQKRLKATVEAALSPR